MSVDAFDARDELRIIGLLLSCFYSSSVVTQSEVHVYKRHGMSRSYCSARFRFRHGAFNAARSMPLPALGQRSSTGRMQGLTLSCSMI